MTSHLGLLPGTFHEIGTNSPAPVARLRLATSDNSLAIEFASDRIDIEKNIADPKGSAMGSLGQFVEMVNTLTGKLLELHPKRAHRLTLITRLLFAEMPEAKMQSIYLKLFRPPPTYAKYPPHEWNWRSVSEVVGKVLKADERFNEITGVNRGLITMRMGGTLNNSQRLIFEFDYNTTQKNSEPRFGPEEIKDFYLGAVTAHDSMVAEIFKFIE